MKENTNINEFLELVIGYVGEIHSQNTGMVDMVMSVCKVTAEENKALLEDNIRLITEVQDLKKKLDLPIRATAKKKTSKRKTAKKKSSGRKRKRPAAKKKSSKKKV